MENKTFFKTIGWAVIITVISCLPLIVSYIVSIVRVNYYVDLNGTLLSGTLLFVALSISSAAWVDANFPFREQNKEWFKYFVHGLFATIVIISIAVYPTLISGDEVEMRSLRTLSITMFLLSIFYSAFSKHIMIKSDEYDKAQSSKSINRLHREVTDKDNRIKELTLKNERLTQELVSYETYFNEQHNNGNIAESFFAIKANEYESMIHKLAQTVYTEIGEDAMWNNFSKEEVATFKDLLEKWK